jgi:putative addiction module component (TIGR02574 family)
MSTYASILQAAMKLSSAERLKLAEALWETAGGKEVVAQLSDEQRAEVARRSAEIDAGAVACQPWEEVRERLRKAAGLNG